MSHGNTITHPITLTIEAHNASRFDITIAGKNLVVLGDFEAQSFQESQPTKDIPVPKVSVVAPMTTQSISLIM